MGAGRKTQTFLTPASAGPSGGGTGPPPQRGLSKSELGGVIFGCTNSTIAECMNHNLFGKYLLSLAMFCVFFISSTLWRLDMIVALTHLISPDLILQSITSS